MKQQFLNKSFIIAILFLAFIGFVLPSCSLAQETNSKTVPTASESVNLAEKTFEASSSIKLKETQIVRYISDNASIIGEEYKTQIAADCIEIEKQARIRILIKTEIVKDLSDGQTKADAFFSEWIRSIGLDKRGILVYALLPEGTAQGRILLKVGIGLKYLVTKEMGENILNQSILPGNVANNDGKGFMDGVASIKRILLDELALDRRRVANEPKTFDLWNFIWSYKEVILGLVLVLFFMYVIFFVERCPKCGGGLRVTKEILKEPGEATLGLQRRIYVCEKCGLSRRKKEPIYPSGRAGLMMRLSGTRRNIRID